MITLLDFLKETLTDIVRANGLPMGLRKVVKGEAGIAIAAETIHGGRIMLLVF